MNQVSLDLAKVIQDEQLERARRARLGSVARQDRQDTKKRFSIRGILGIPADTEPACVTCPIPSS